MLHFVNDDFSHTPTLGGGADVVKSLAGEEIARDLITVLSATYNIHPNNLLGAMPCEL